MATRVPCPHCGQAYNVPEQKLGKTIKCQKCSKSFVLTAQQAPPAPEPPVASASIFIEETPPPHKTDQEKPSLRAIWSQAFGGKSGPAPADLIEAYSVVYKGGHPEYPQEKVGKIDFNVFPNRFELLATIGTKAWFDGLVVPFASIRSLEIVERQVGTVEGLLGGLNSRQLNQRNNIHITYQPETGREILLRLEMLTGITVMGQAKKCQEFMDRLRTNGILESFQPKASANGAPAAHPDIPAQIEKLAALRDRKIISDEEFAAKKADLLAKM